MPKSDWDYFNCSQKHEIDYVVGLYPDNDRDDVREAIKEMCEKHNNMTHSFLYEKLKEKGFIKEQ